MTIKNGETPDVARMNLDQTRGTRGVAASGTPGSASTAPASGSDSISLSTPSGILQQALTSGIAARSARIQELQNQINSNQYPIDAQAVSRAIVDAHLAGD